MTQSPVTLHPRGATPTLSAPNLFCRISRSEETDLSQYAATAAMPQPDVLDGKQGAAPFITKPYVSRSEFLIENRSIVAEQNGWLNDAHRRIDDAERVLLRLGPAFDL